MNKVLGVLSLVLMMVAVQAQMPSVPTPSEIAARQRKVALDYCRSHVYFPNRIDLLNVLDGKTQVYVYLDDTPVLVGTVEQLRKNADDAIKKARAR